jgi:fructose transport system ATP-binding protein
MNREHGKLALQALGLTKRFGGVIALNGVDIELRRGELLGLVGDNGAGKSTLIKVLTGVQPKDEGRIFIEGEEVDLRSPSDAKERGIETVYQNLALIDIFDVPTNLFLGRELKRNDFLGRFFGIQDRKAMHRESGELMERLYLDVGKLRREVANFSGGQRQAVAIARSVYWGKKVVIFDEPTAALGVKESSKVMELIASLKEHGMSMIMISHNLQHVFDLCDRVFVLRRGERAAVVRTVDVTPDEVVGLITGTIRSHPKSEMKSLAPT